MISTSEALGEAMRDLAWSLWTELGVSGTVRRHDQVLTDPEALILFTAALGDRDPRLRDESLDWCVRYGGAISVTRLKNLLGSGLGDQQALDGYASMVNQHTSLSWPVSKRLRAAKTSPGRLSGKSQEPDLRRRPALLRLRLRALFGVGARADVIAELLCGSSRSAAELAAAGYSKRGIANILDDLYRADLLSRTQVGNTHRFELKRPRDLEPLVGASPVYYAYWADCLEVLLVLDEMFREVAAKSERLKILAANRVIIDIADSLERLRWGVPVAADVSAYWQAIESWAIERATRAAQGPPDPERFCAQIVV